MKIYKMFFLWFCFLTILILSCQVSQRDKKLNKNAGIKGTITFQGKPVDWAYAYVYKDADTNYKKPYAAISEPTKRDGRFILSLDPGKYYLLARKRWNYAATGPLRIGDYSIDYSQNPVQLEKNRILEINLDIKEIKSESPSHVAHVSGINGKILFKQKFNPDLMSGVYVYVYLNNDTELRGPNYYALSKPDEKGNFTVDLPAGKYYLTVRKRSDKNKFGLLKPGDFNADYDKNPVEVKLNTYTKPDDIILGEIDPGKWKDIQSGQIKPVTKTIIRGIIKNKSGQPQKGIYAFVYKDSQMIGKPLYRSIVTGNNGSYEIYLSEGGNYYVGARDTYGGPLAPGDTVGSYNGNPEHILAINSGEIKENVDIEVEEFY